MFKLALCALAGLAVGCASTPGARPHDMSAAQHESQAREAARSGDAEAAQYDPNAGAKRTQCAPKGGCWTSMQNPTEEHLRTAERFRRQAADHRAASATLREAETIACGGIESADRDMSPFDQTEDITSVAPLLELTSSKQSQKRTAGAVVTFRAVPGMTAEWLQRVVDCHLARNGALGHVIPEMPNCPLVPRGVEARVSSTGNGFAVAIRSDDADTAREILARAVRLKESR